MHVLLGIGERRTLRHADFVTYYRRLRRGFEAAIGRPGATEPYPVEHCGLCEFRQVCDERRRRWRQRALQERDELIPVVAARAAVQ